MGTPLLKTKAMQVVEAREGRRIDDLLRALYHEDRLTQEQIAARLGVTRGTVIQWMREFAVPTGYNVGTPKAAA